MFTSLLCSVASAEIKSLLIPSAIISSTFFWSSELFLFLTKKSNRADSLLLNLQRFAMSTVLPICANATIELPLSLTLLKSFVDNPITLLTPVLVMWSNIFATLLPARTLLISCQIRSALIFCKPDVFELIAFKVSSSHVGVDNLP